MRIFYAIALLLLVSCTTLKGQASPFPWPDGRRAAIVLTYDDSLPTHLDVAIPQLDEAGLKGTFFLDAKFPPDMIDGWRRAAGNGHELANHTIFHPCQKDTFTMEPRYYNESYSLKAMLDELSIMNTLLRAIDGKQSRTYATTCGQKFIGDGIDYAKASFDRGLFTAVRGIGLPQHNPREINPWDYPSEWFPEDATGEDMISRVKHVEEQGGLLVLGFHGVGGDRLIVSANAHKELVEYLAQKSETIWVPTFQEAAAWIAIQKPATVQQLPTPAE